MGSRAVVVVCRTPEAAARRFLIEGTPADEHSSAVGIVHTRTGRSFFTDDALGSAFVARVGAAVETAGIWDELGTDWLLLDAELMPWSFKAGDLLRRQYASVGAAARAETQAAVAAIAAAQARGVEPAALDPLHDARARERAAATGFTEAYRRYCWDVRTLDDLTLAPFQVLAGEGEVHARRNHLWHLGVIERLAAADPGFIRVTPSRVVDLGSDASAPTESERGATEWWESLTAAGGEGMVVKPIEAVVQRDGQLVQPGIKCRGSEYLRIIYGPDYLAPANLERLRRRRLGHKRSLALREFALGIEALDRFVAEEPLYRVHECVFAVLALESEPVDPRL